MNLENIRTLVRLPVANILPEKKYLQLFDNR